MSLFRPMLAVDHEEARLRFPYLASPKLDGIRCLILDGGAKTRSMKRLPNDYVHEWFQRNPWLADMDGELIVGEPTAKDCYTQTTSGIMAVRGQPSFQFFVFDMVDRSGRLAYTERAKEAQARLVGAQTTVGWLEQTPVHDLAELRRYEEVVVGMGFEGVMLRAPEGRYKQGRATVSEGTLLKVKRFSDSEARIVGTEEQMHNSNTGFRNALGRTQRSSAQAGMVGKGTLGALIVEGLPGQPFAGVRFGLGTGFDDALRASLWARRASLPGLTVRYRYFDFGTKDSPRFPVFTGFREGGV